MQITERYVVILFCCMAFSVSGQVAHAATYYVSKAGSDGYSCPDAASQSTPKLTLNNAVRCLSAGDTLYVKAGTYAESLAFSVPAGTSWSNVVRIAAYPGDVVWMRPNAGENRVLEFAYAQQYIEFDGINLDGANVKHDTVKINAIAPGNVAHHIRIQNAEVIGRAYIDPVIWNNPQVIITTKLENGLGDGFNEFINLQVHSVGGHGFYIQSSNNLVEGCEIWDVGYAGVQIYNGYVFNPANNIIRNNTIRDITTVNADGRKNGIIIYGGSGNKAYNNVIYNIVGTAESTAGIQVGYSSASEIYNNTIYGVNYHGIRLDTGVRGTVLRNNIAYGNADNLGDFGSIGTVQSTNLFSVDPLFVDARARNFRLQSSSPAVDAGASIVLVTEDRIGTLRPQGGAHDVGAYELPSHNAAPARPSGLQVVAK